MVVPSSRHCSPGDPGSVAKQWTLEVRWEAGSRTCEGSDNNNIMGVNVLVIFMIILSSSIM